MLQPLPDAPRQTVGPLQAGDACFDPRPEVAQLVIHLVALHHVLNLQALLFVEGYIFHAFGLLHVVFAGVTAVCGHFPGSTTRDLDLPLQQGHKAFAIGRVTFLDDGIKNQPATTACQVQLVPVLDVTAALDNDVGVLFEQTEDLLCGRHLFAFDHPSLRLVDYPFNQAPVVRYLRLPGDEGGPIHLPSVECEPGLVQVIETLASDFDQIPIPTDLLVFAPGILDLIGPLLGHPPVVTPSQSRLPSQFLRLFHQSHLSNNRIPQQSAVRRRVNRCLRDGAIDPYLASALDLLRLRIL